MFNFLVSSNPEAWNGEPYSYERTRLFEYTEDAIIARFNELSDEQIERLQSIPAVFAYENSRTLDARVGQITSIRIRNRQVLVSYKLDDNVAPIPWALFEERQRTLDISDWEMNRTHWAVKDVDLPAFLEEQGLLVNQNVGKQHLVELDELPISAPIPISPKAFHVPTELPDPLLVSVMMPINPNFDGMLGAVRGACEALGLTCVNASEVWHDDVIIQDIFSLIFRSRIVICDFTTQNPNVFYEAGIAHTLGKPVVPITQDINALPFDLRHRRALVYADGADGLVRLRADITPRLVRLLEVEP